MRPTAEQAMVRVQEYIDFLETNGVPTALLKERVQAVHAWGKSVRLRQPDAAKPRSEEMKGIQRALDAAVASENSVRENRKRHPFYPYQSEEQHRLAEMLSGIDISEKAKQSIFKALHGGDGKKSLLRDDLQGSKLLTVKGIDSCARNLPTYAPHVPTPAEEKRAPVAMMRTLCSVKWNVETIDIDSANGDTQTVDIQWRDALLALQHHFLTAEYTEDELLFEPQIAERLADMVFDDYCNSLIYYLQCSYLPEGQYPLLYEFSSDGSQFGLCRQAFWSVYVTPCLPCKSRRQMSACKILVAQLPHVEGPDEKAEMYQHAITKIFDSTNAAGTFGILMSFRGAASLFAVVPVPKVRQACACRGGKRHGEPPSVPVGAHNRGRQPGALHSSRHAVRIRNKLPMLGVLDAQGRPRRRDGSCAMAGPHDGNSQGALRGDRRRLRENRPGPVHRAPARSNQRPSRRKQAHPRRGRD
jgi:hypothetical protein